MLLLIITITVIILYATTSIFSQKDIMRNVSHVGPKALFLYQRDK